MALGDVYEVAFVGAQTGSVIVSTLNYRVTLSIGPKANEMQALAEEMLNSVLPAYTGLHADDLTWNTIKVRDVHDAALGFDRPVTVSGVGISEPMPKQIAALVIWKTGLFGRRNTGRLYIPGIEEAQWNGTAWTSAFLTAITDFTEVARTVSITSFPDLADQFEFEQVVHSETYDVTNAVVTFGVSPNPATQRRRKSGVGV